VPSGEPESAYGFTTMRRNLLFRSTPAPPVARLRPSRHSPPAGGNS